MTLSRQNLSISVSRLETSFRCAMGSSAKALLEELIPLKGFKVTLAELSGVPHQPAGPRGGGQLA